MSDLPVSNTGVTLEENNILDDVKFLVREYGKSFTIYDESESTVTRSRYGAIKKTSKGAGLTLYADPLEFDPDKDRLELAGIYEEVNVIAWISMKEWLDLGYSYSDFDNIRFRAEIDGNEYEIKDKNRVNKYGSVYTYITLGLSGI